MPGYFFIVCLCVRVCESVASSLSRTPLSVHCAVAALSTGIRVLQWHRPRAFALSHTHCKKMLGLCHAQPGAGATGGVRSTAPACTARSARRAPIAARRVSVVVLASAEKVKI